MIPNDCIPVSGVCAQNKTYTEQLTELSQNIKASLNEIDLMANKLFGAISDEHNDHPKAVHIEALIEYMLADSDELYHKLKNIGERI